MLLARKKSLFLCKKFSFCQAKKLTQASTAVSEALKLKEGDKLSGYVVKQVNEVPELHLATVRLQHEATAADHFHVARNDKNNLFSVAFRTTPTNSTGVPHILEHLTLCGSRQFPCRDPFFKMLNRSLATFMNAFTGSDYTMYPFSTQNGKDFENLLRVYLDAVFFPCLREGDFSQEGWRLEHQDINDKNSPIIFKGVVFNEMKGVFSDANQYYAQHLENKLFPSHAYSHVSGGDPFHIPELTWTELKRFHSEHYHPSNSRFFTYGDLPIESHLENIQAFVLSKFSKIRLSNEVIEEKIWEQPREEVIYCQHDPMAAIPEKQTTISVSYLLKPITETYDSFALNILCNLLVDGPNAPFYHSLLESGIGADYSPSYGYSGQTKQSCFSIGLCGIHEKDVSQVKEIIESTFDNVIKEGFPSDRIEAVLHNIELLTKHQVSNFGLHAAMAVNAIWNHGGDPINSLKVNDHVQWFRKQMKENPLFLQDKIILHFQNNQHKLMLTMTPSESFKKETEDKEKRLLESKVSVLTAIDKQKIFDEGKELAHYQSRVEDVSCLPTLLIRDVQKVIEKTQMQNVICSDGVSVQLCEQPTNEVVYFKALSTVGNLPEELQKLLPLFSSIVTKMGAGDRDYKQLDQFADLTTGGLNASVHVSENATDCNLFEKGVVFSSFCLEKNLDHMLSLWEDIFTRLLLNDTDRLSRLIKMTAAEMAQGISYQGHILSMIRASSCLSPCANVKEQLFGLSQVTFMKELAEMTDYDAIMEKLSKISSVLLRKDSLRCAINAGPSAMSTSLGRVESFITSLTAGDRIIDENDKLRRNFAAASQHMHFVLPFAVNYLGKSMMTIPFNHEDSASLKTAARLLSSKYLHREIRERGGAYGSGAKLSNGGLFMLYSYRDPNVSQTLENFSSGIEWLLNKEYTDTDIEESKLSVFSEIDKPVSPGHKGMAHFLYSISDDMKQQLRERLFGVTKDDIVAVAEKYLLNSKFCGVSLIGPENEETGRNHKWIIHKE